MDVLQGHVNVARDLRTVRDGPDQIVGPVGGMGVEQTDPELARQGIQFPEQRAKRGCVGRQRGRSLPEPVRRGNGTGAAGSQIQSVIRGVLGDEVQFAHALREQLPGFLDDIGLGPAPMAAPHGRDDAEAARMIASLGDLQVE